MKKKVGHLALKRLNSILGIWIYFMDEVLMTAKRTDANQKEIVETFRKMGATVLILSDLGKGAPDLLIGYSGVNYLVEVKDGLKTSSQRKLTASEAKFFDTWKGHVEIIKSVDEVIKFISARRPMPYAFC